MGRRADSKFIIVWLRTLENTRYIMEGMWTCLVKHMAKEIEVMLHAASGVRRHFGFSLHFTGQYLLDVLASVNTAVRTRRSFRQSLGTETSSGCTV